MQAPTSISVEHCTSLVEVREHIDALDERIVALIAQRSGYVAQAAHIKKQASEVSDPARVERVVERVRAQARSLQAPADVLEATYRAMIAAFIVYEQGEFQRLQEV